MTELTDNEFEFLAESNAIEKEYSNEALEDAKCAWHLAIKHRHNINLDYIKLIHQELLRRLNPQIAGKFRTVQVGVWTKDGFKEFIGYDKIEEYLLGLLDIEVNVEEGIKNWHIAFEKIHPFEDGNGRVGRILMNIQRSAIGLPLLIIHEGAEQQEYYKWFKDEEALQ